MIGPMNAEFLLIIAIGIGTFISKALAMTPAA